MLEIIKKIPVDSDSCVPGEFELQLIEDPSDIYAEEIDVLCTCKNCNGPKDTSK